MNKTKKAFTIVELLICIAIISVLAVVITTTSIATYNDSKEDIIENYNNSKVIAYYNNEIIFSGNSEDMPNYKEQYELYDLKYNNGITEMYFKDKENV